MTALLGVPACPGSPGSGEDAEPARLRREGVLAELALRGVAAADAGDVAGVPAGSGAAAVLAQAAAVREAVQAALTAHGAPLVVLGGDCSLVLGVLPGARAALGAELGLVWLGRFANANVPETTPSGAVAGMALALLAGEGDPTLVTALGGPLLDGDAMRLVARDLDPGEGAVLEGCGIRRVALDALDPPPGPLYVAIECGLLDRPDGPALADVETALRGLAATAAVAVVALTGTRPDRVSGADVAALASAALGR
jgi:arginase